MAQNPLLRCFWSEHSSLFWILSRQELPERLRLRLQTRPFCVFLPPVTSSRLPLRLGFWFSTEHLSPLPKLGWPFRLLLKWLVHLLLFPSSLWPSLLIPPLFSLSSFTSSHPLVSFPFILISFRPSRVLLSGLFTSFRRCLSPPFLFRPSLDIVILILYRFFLSIIYCATDVRALVFFGRYIPSQTVFDTVRPPLGRPRRHRSHTHTPTPPRPVRSASSESCLCITQLFFRASAATEQDIATSPAQPSPRDIKD